MNQVGQNVHNLPRTPCVLSSHLYAGHVYIALKKKTD
jgi:hypothetical protein